MAIAQDDNPGLAFLKAAAAHPDDTAIEAEGLRIGYGQLRDIVISMALHLVRRGVGQGDTVGLRTDDALVVIATVYATALLGARYTFARRRLVESRRLHFDLLLQTEPLDGPPLPGAVTMDDGWARPPEDFDISRPLSFAGYRDPDDIWIISETSGTTGTPKLVALSYRALARRTAAHGALFDRPGFGLVSLFRVSAPAFLSRALATLAHRGRLVMSADPAYWVAADVGQVMGSVAQIRQRMEDVTLPRKLAAVHLSGGAAPDSFVKHLMRSFDRVQNGYGSTEANNLLANVKSLAEDGTVRTRTELRPGATIEIVDEAGTPLPPGREGIVRITNPYLASGYLDAPEAQAACFRDGWFYPGDLGMWTSEGTFVVTGRVNDQFNLGGVKLNAALLDYTLMTVPGMRDAITFLMPHETAADRLTAFLTLDPQADPTEVLAAARVELMRVGGRAAVPERFLFADSLPRNPNGKADRAGCVALVKAGKGRRQAPGR